MDAALLKKWEGVVGRYDELTSRLMDLSVIAQPALLAKLNKERTEIEAIAQLFHHYQGLTKQLDEATHMLEDPSAGAELHSLASEERARLTLEQSEVETQVLAYLTPKDPRDEKNLFLEIRAGTGGDEAAIFAGDLLRMYGRYAESRGFTVEVLSESPGEHGGYKEVITRIAGRGAYSRLKFESGTHRVQR